ncbi:uncharacterized protein LOC110045390 [Orbicella faveolata]|uniref:uncharacterized protein LOC110045389 n=1 Tax=Orbicella faveolata TaxID=48498 RepID=UPI0009E4EAC3|nr:uncharacterized protein LOC110045389 [Orbicella faveolata]XP_020606652.1 uncharacterized protein LOC110045390 [Orbicella faveolata]
MDQVDRKASTKEFEEEGIVNQECVTVESTDGLANRDKATVSSPPKIIFCVREPAPNHSALLKGIPNEPISQPLDNQVLFGRGHGVGVFLNDEEASREHMKLFLQTNPATYENVFVVKTVSSTKPVYINGSPLYKQAGETVLNTNDRLKIGQLEFIVTVEPGNSVDYFQLEFTRSGVNLQQPNMQEAVNTPQLRGGVNPGQVFMANQVGAVILPNNGVPANPAVNMNISANGGVSYYGMPMAPTYQPMPVGMGHPTYHPMSAGMGYSTYQPMPAGIGHPTCQPTPAGMGYPTYQPMPAGMGHPTYQPTPAAMGQSFFRPQPTHPRFHSSPCSEPQQESLPSGIYGPALHENGHASAQDRREMFLAKQPSEQSEVPTETGLEEDSHISIQETGKPKTL